MQAILLDALQCVIGPERQRAREGLCAREWIDTHDREWPFSFESICDALGLDADALRRRLRNAPRPVCG